MKMKTWPASTQGVPRSRGRLRLYEAAREGAGGALPGDRRVWRQVHGVPGARVQGDRGVRFPSTIPGLRNSSRARSISIPSSSTRPRQVNTLRLFRKALKRSLEYTVYPSLRTPGGGQDVGYPAQPGVHTEGPHTLRSSPIFIVNAPGIAGRLPPDHEHLHGREEGGLRLTPGTGRPSAPGSSPSCPW
jgi:hypothetical protein